MGTATNHKTWIKPLKRNPPYKAPPAKPRLHMAERRFKAVLGYKILLARLNSKEL